MNHRFDVISRSDHAFVSATRVLLGLFVLVTGVMTFFVPAIRLAFIQQLSAAGLPLVNLSLFMLPVVEGVVGLMLIGSVMVRLASLVTVVLMGMLTYVHLAVPEPTLYPLQFGLPLIPAVALVLAAFLYFVDRYEDPV